MDIVLLDMKVGIGLGGEVLLERAMSVCVCVLCERCSDREIIKLILHSNLLNI